jgi:hypothetical protein
LEGLEKFQMAVVADGMPAMKRLLRSKKAKLLMHEIHKEIFELGPPTPRSTSRRGAQGTISG